MGEGTHGRHEPPLCRQKPSRFEPPLCSKRASTIQHNFFKILVFMSNENFNNFFSRSGMIILLKIRVIGNIYGLIKWFIRFILKLWTFLTQRGRYLEKYFWSKLDLFCCNLWFKQYLFWKMLRIKKNYPNFLDLF